MATLVVDKAPTLEDAARAAEAIAEHDPHVVRVVVFGSVAKQTQRPGSDIDIIAISDASRSLGEGRGAAEYALRQAAEAACGIKCEVILTTIGEWEWSLEHARSSVFGEAHAHGITLFERPCPPSAPSAEETVMSRDDWGLALKDLEEAHRKNLELLRILKSIPGEAATGEWLPADRSYTYESALESAHMSIEKCLTALGRLHLRRYLDNTHNIDIMAGKLRPTPSGPFVDSVLEMLDTAEDDGSHTNWRLAPYLGQSDSFQQMITPENTAAHIRAAADLLEHALAAIANSALRPTPIPAGDATILNRCAEPIDYLRHHATAHYLQTGAPLPTTEEVFERIEGKRLGRISSEEVVAALEAERARR
ncbi:MAG: nucleotidyltransferase domain-containing protein [bacterium]|nr:nucleotidyltransferase domain-containing protein [bacterium]